MEKEIDLEKLIRKLSNIDIDKWTTIRGFERGAYRTSLEDQFDVSLSVNYKDKLFNADDRDYTLSISPRIKFNPIIFYGKEVRELYNLIECKYDKKKEMASREDKRKIIQELNEFLEKE